MFNNQNLNRLQNRMKAVNITDLGTNASSVNANLNF